MSTGTISTYRAPEASGSVARLAIRAGHALESWGRRKAQPLSRAQLEQRIAVEREARAAIASRSDAHAGVHQRLS